MQHSHDPSRIAIIIGAGPAGLTAAYELLARTNYIPIVLEASQQVGGISRTEVHNGNRIDIGGHRFFSKSDRINDWWFKMLPRQGPFPARGESHCESLSIDPSGPNPEIEDRVMLRRSRLSRIHYLGQLFSYPLELSSDLIRHLGPARTLRIGIDYLGARLFPIKPERSLEDFLRNRFGTFLYRTFFKDYTEKLWGVECSSIKPEWGAQRIKGLSLRKALQHALLRKGDSQNVETSLIGQFDYPKFGPGQMWEEVAARITATGGELLTQTRVDTIEFDGHRVIRVKAVGSTGEPITFERPAFVFSSMPIKELFPTNRNDFPKRISEIASGLTYRDFMTVGLLLTTSHQADPASTSLLTMRDNWLYIQEPNVQLGRIQIFNNWSPYLVADPSKTWVGLEYFATEGDHLWKRSDAEMLDLATRELEQLGIANELRVEDSVVIRQPKAYPAYFGTYEHLQEVRDFVDGIENLFLIGRNGMHRYNNQDHSMLAAMTAVDVIIDSSKSKKEVWAVNTESEYHESK